MCMSEKTTLISEFSDEMSQIEEYIKEHIDPESEYLHQLYRATHLHLLYPRMASGHIQGRLLKMFVGMIKPKLILEIGTYSGYSGLCLAEGLPEDGHLHTIEINDEQEDFTLPWFKNSPYADKITMHIGNAMEIIPKLGLIWHSSMVTNEYTQIITSWYLNISIQEDISSQTTLYGMDMCSTRIRKNVTSRQEVFKHSMTL